MQPKAVSSQLHYLGFQKESISKRTKQTREKLEVFLAIGLVLGALIYTLTLSPTGFWSTSVQLWRAAAGLLVGFGTRLSGGCTSGHGVSGLISLSVTSLSAVIVFMGIAIVTANVVQLIGVLP